MGIKGPSLLKEEKRIIQEEEISGVILFKRNIVSLPQVYELCREIKSLTPPPLIVMDREGGRVDRLRHLNTFSWPSPKQLAKQASLKEIKLLSFLMNRELKHLRVDVNCAPCLDVEQVKSSLFKDRLLGSELKDVIPKSLAVLSGMNRAGVISCVKHFPGHGAVVEDSHHLLPVDGSSLESIRKNSLPVFRKAISQRVPLVMIAHVLYRHWDPNWPASLSEKILTQGLKKQMGFRGLVVSDDLDMKALSCFIKRWSQRLEFSTKKQIAFWALKAGIDILLYGQASQFVWGLPDFFRQVASKNLSLKKEMSSKINKINRFKKKILAQNLKRGSFKTWKNVIDSPQSRFELEKIFKSSQ